MSGSAEQPERLAEILRQILALSDQKRTNLQESAAGTNNGSELFNGQCIDEIHEQTVSREKAARRE